MLPPPCTGVSTAQDPSRPDLLQAEKRMLALIAAGTPLREVLDVLMHTLEAKLTPGTLASILLVDAQGKLRPGSAPSLPATYTACLDGLPTGPNLGSCGTAAHTQQLVVVRDIATDPRWEGYRSMALDHGLAACWSTPIIGTDGKTLGTFALYSRTPCEPTPEDLKLIDRVAFIARIAIERHLHDAERRALLANLERARQEAERDRAKLRQFFARAPMLLCITRGPEHRVELVNAPVVQRFGGRTLVGHPAREVMPELEGQDLFEVLDHVFRKGRPWMGHAVPLVLQGSDTPLHFDVSFQPLHDATGEVTGVGVYAHELLAPDASQPAN